MKKRLNQKDRFKYFLVDVKNLNYVKVYKRGFRSKKDAEYAKASVYSGNKWIAILTGYELLFMDPSTYRLYPYKGRILRPSAYLKKSPHSEARVRRARKIFNYNPKYKPLKRRGIHKSKVLNALVTQILLP